MSRVSTGGTGATKGVGVRLVRPVTVVLAWLLLVTGVAAGAWFVVDATGRAVGVPAADADAVPPSPVGASPTPSSTPARSGTPSLTASPGVTPSASRSPVPSAGPSPTPSPGRGLQPTDGGTLVVYCDGTTVERWAVRLVDGWRGQTSQQSASDVQATFTAADGRGIVVHGTCRAPGPTFSTGALPPSPTST
jgi:hypothetical protein